MDKYQEIKNQFILHQDKERAISMSNYLRDQFQFYGIPTPKRRAIYKQFLKEEKKRKRIDWNLLDLCYEDEYRELQYFVCDYLNTMKAYLSYEDIPHMKQYIKVKQ